MEYRGGQRSYSKRGRIHKEAIMKLIAFALAAFTLMLGSLGIAQAQRLTNYPFCAVYDSRTVSCAFNTMAQCYATVSGRGGFCEPNADYRPPVTAVRRKKSS
jgi:hypothetical protein